MAENNFLSGIKVDSFIKANNDQIKETIGAAFGGAQKSVAELIKLQKITVLELKQLNDKGKGRESKDLKKSLDSTLRSIQKENLKMSKSRDATMIKSLKGFFGKTKQNAETKKESRDYFKKENYSKKSNSLLDSINKGINGLLKKNKEEKKESLLSKIMGFAGTLAKVLAVAGLAGFLLTGKKEFLFDMVKQLKWAAKFAMAPFKLLTKIPQMIKGVQTAMKGIQTLGKTISTGFKIAQKMGTRAALEYGARTAAKKIGTKVGETGAKIAGSRMGKLAQRVGGTALGKAVGAHVGSKVAGVGARIASSTVGKKVAGVGAHIAGSTVGKAVGKKVAGIAGSKAVQLGVKTAGKVAGKSAAKVGLKKIPVVGTILAIGFAYQRIKKGDVLGGILELASGVAAIFPGVGTAISFGIDGLLLAKDIAGALKPEAKKADAKASSEASSTKQNLPALGKNMGDSNTLGGGSIKKPKPYNPVKVTPSSVMSSIKRDMASKSVFKIKDKDKDKKVGGIGAMTFGGVGSNFSSAIGSAEGIGGKLTAAAGVGREVFNNVVKGSDGVGWRKASSNVDVSGINPAIWNNFVGMAQEYAQKGGVIDITSGSRSPAKQQALWNEAVRTGRTKYVAKPGRSMHEFGYAIDMDRGDGGALERMGLLSKWHFARPMAHEPWHTELAGLKGQYDSVRSGKMKYSGEQQIEKPGGGVKGNVGDAYSMMKKITPKSVPIPKDLLGGAMDTGVGKLNSLKDMVSAIPSQLSEKTNLPMGDIANKIQNSKPVQVLLGATDINTLAMAIGEAMKKALPTPKNITTPMSGGGRGSI